MLDGFDLKIQVNNHKWLITKDLRPAKIEGDSPKKGQRPPGHADQATGPTGSCGQARTLVYIAFSTTIRMKAMYRLPSLVREHHLVTYR